MQAEELRAELSEVRAELKEVSASLEEAEEELEEAQVQLRKAEVAHEEQQQRCFLTGANHMPSASLTSMLWSYGLAAAHN